MIARAKHAPRIALHANCGNERDGERQRGQFHVEDLPRGAVIALREEGAGGSNPFQVACFHPLGHLGQRLR